MAEREYIFLTGATGQIGRYLLRDLLLKDRPLVVLARERNGKTGRERIAELICKLEESIGCTLPMPKVLEGDATLDSFGLSKQNVSWLRENCGTLLHNAASLNFNGGGTNKTWKSNVASAQVAVDVCAEAQVGHLAFVSTAYVCGDRSGVIYENELDGGQAFKNEYEHSKFEAERIVRVAEQPDAVTVFRPSIVVGDYLSGETQSYHSFYRTVQFTKSFADSADKDDFGHWKHNVRLNLKGNEIWNLVPVDWVSSAMTKILLRPEAAGKTYHLTPSRPTTTEEIEQALQAVFNYDGVTFAGDRQFDLSSGSPEEQRFYQYVDEYSDYWGRDPIFDRSQTDWAIDGLQERRVDVACLKRLIQFAVEDRFGRGKKKRRTRGTVQPTAPVHTV